MSTRSTSLRRSRRAPKRISDYNAGDVVEVSLERIWILSFYRCDAIWNFHQLHDSAWLRPLFSAARRFSPLHIFRLTPFYHQIDRSGVTLQARLAQLLTEGTSPNPRWLIKFDGQPYKDEEVYEQTFGKLLIAADDEPESLHTEPAPPRRQNSGKSTNSSTSSSTSINAEFDKKIAATVKTDEGLAGQVLPAKDGYKDAAADKKDKKSVTFSNENSPIGSDESSTQETGTEGGNVSARESRSLRRQTMIDESDGVLAWTGGTGNLTAGGKRRLPPGGSSGKNGSKSKRPRQEGDDSVVKVKLLTGTLYLYRGRNRRAEFIRRV